MSIKEQAIVLFKEEGFTNEPEFNQGFDIEWMVDELVLSHKAPRWLMYQGWGWTAEVLFPFAKGEWPDTSWYYTAIAVEDASRMSEELSQTYAEKLVWGLSNRLHLGDHPRPKEVGWWAMLKRRLFTPMHLIPPNGSGSAVVVWTYRGK